MNIRIGCDCALGKRGVPNTFDNCRSQKAVVLPCLLSESEETKEDKRAKDSRPSTDLERVEKKPVLV